MDVPVRREWQDLQVGAAERLVSASMRRFNSCTQVPFARASLPPCPHSPDGRDAVGGAGAFELVIHLAPCRFVR